jgi:hypothetical protein
MILVAFERRKSPVKALKRECLDFYSLLQEKINEVRDAAHRDAAHRLALEKCNES